ncbi:type III-B CRISPR module-associated protein Cmr5 [Hyperthermus butylicus]|uniref:CRISPR type III-B/RAMP module-associated protein Cmr5 n=1 Tax=Hyperthermus butylicus (strain DSM 5456 / JCM 9403 / PLM1-5) TaxID=415426 RepID=A2BKQ5_HYPBU|nr:type III-B CRISPR module-associated protein Cmr5 [Hyperthermus butylicus]ABM80566.1 hypothetical protein Hbut_0711 [Hyperthermus butylicus DSM 5456]
MSRNILPNDPVEAALEAMRRFDKNLRDACSDKGEPRADAISRRLKDFPQLILQSGLVPALTFYLSKLSEKADQDAYELTVKVLTEQRLEGDERRKLCRKTSGEGGGYPHVLALVLVYAAERAGCSVDSIARIGSSLVGCLETVQKKGVTVEKLVQAYVNELKKLASALYPEKKT